MAFSAMYYIALLLLLTMSSCMDAVRYKGPCKVASTDVCFQNEFRCLTGQCIGKIDYCDNKSDCPDASDEAYCTNYIACPDPLRRCRGSRKCIPSWWFCDRTSDCPNGADEENCDYSKVQTRMDYNYKNALIRAKGYLESKRKMIVTGTLNTAVQKLAIAEYFADTEFSQTRSPERKEMALQTSIQFLSLLNSKGSENISSFEIASFVNAFLVTCIDPRKFYSMDLISELRTRVNSENYTNPYVYLTLCNAGEFITEKDVNKLNSIFLNDRHNHQTGTQAMGLMALACALKQSDTIVNSSHLQTLAEEIKRKQYVNGTVENIQTTALVMQALYASLPDEDPDNFDEEKALHQLYSSQKQDASFGSLLNTYYVLPVFRCSSLVNISSSHCPTPTRVGDPMGQTLARRKGPKIRVKYSLRIGENKDLEKILILRVPDGMSFYNVMDAASDIDDQYRFEYIVRDRKPYITAIADVENDPESGAFWFAYTLTGNKTTPIETPADVFPKENDHLLMWYQMGS